MLNNVPIAINRMARNVVINHPNSFNCVLIRKRVTRASDAMAGGLPTLGGMGVMSSDDEESVEWDRLGNGYALSVNPFSASAMMDRQDANNGYEYESRFLIEPEEAGDFAPKKHDVVFLIMGDVRLAYEIIKVETTSNIPPFTQRYVCNSRDELDFSRE